MLIKYPYTTPDVDDILKEKHPDETMLAAFGMLNMANILKQTGKMTPEEWCQLWIGRADRDVYVDFSDDAGSGPQMQKIKKDVTYYPVGYNMAWTGVPNDLIFYYTKGSYSLHHNYVQNASGYNKYFVMPMVECVIYTLRGYGLDAKQVDASLMIGDKKIGHIMNEEVIFPYMASMLYLNFEYDDAKFKEALPDNLFAKSFRSICNSGLEKIKTPSGIKNELDHIDECEFFHKVCNMIFKGQSW